MNSVPLLFHAAVLALQLHSVASVTPCLRARLAVFAPASCSEHRDDLLLDEPLALHRRFPFVGPNVAWRKILVTGDLHLESRRSASLFGGLPLAACHSLARLFAPQAFRKRSIGCHHFPRPAV